MTLARVRVRSRPGVDGQMHHPVGVHSVARRSTRHVSGRGHGHIDLYENFMLMARLSWLLMSSSS